MLGNQRIHSLHARGYEVFEDMTHWAEVDLLPLLKNPAENWCVVVTGTQLSILHCVKRVCV